jgi:hypothetical protein
MGNKMSNHSLVFIIVFFLLVFSSCQGKNIKDEVLSNDRNISLVDSVFTEHLNYLEEVKSDMSIIAGKEAYRKFNSVIEFFTTTTDLDSQRDMTYGGFMYTEKRAFYEDYDKWKKWYLENRLNLRWDQSEKKIIFLNIE